MNLPNEEPGKESINIINEGKDIFFYNNFYLIEKDIFLQIYDIKEECIKDMESKNYYCKCFYYDDFIFIELNNKITCSDKIILEVGHIEYSINKFILEYLFLLNNEKDYKESFDYLKKYKFKEYFGIIQSNSQNLLPLKLKNNTYGYIYKYNQKKVEKAISKKEIQNQPQVEPQIEPKHIPPIEPNPIPQNAPIIPIYRTILNIFKYNPPKMGLQNVGATCYMNATIQCFCQITKLVNQNILNI